MAPSRAVCHGTAPGTGTAIPAIGSAREGGDRIAGCTDRRKYPARDVSGRSAADRPADLRHAPDGTTDTQPPVWTDIYFEADEKDADDLAAKLADALDAHGWYADFRSATETVVVYRHKIFRYPRGNAAGRAEAVAHGRAHGVPGHQLDWPV